MKIAIHKTSGGFDHIWIEYCSSQGIDLKYVDCYSNTIIQDLKDCDALMWHHHHGNSKDLQFAKELLVAVRKMGVVVFPDYDSDWHFDDKVAQKYLFEAVDAPLVPSYVFYDKDDALKWVHNVSYPKVFKLRGGAGASNVCLAHNSREAVKLIQKSFGRGFSQFNRLQYLKDTWKKWRSGIGGCRLLLSGVYRYFVSTSFAKSVGNEKGYAYFQQFIPNNSFDIRVIVIGDKAFALKRMVRKGDFRASGSGTIVYDKTQIDERCIQIAFETSKKLNSFCLAYDFVFNESGNPLIVEVSYGFSYQAYSDCEGYWNRQLDWCDAPVKPCEWMIEGVIEKITQLQQKNS